MSGCHEHKDNAQGVGRRGLIKREVLEGLGWKRKEAERGRGQEFKDGAEEKEG